MKKAYMIVELLLIIGILACIGGACFGGCDGCYYDKIGVRRITVDGHVYLKPRFGEGAMTHSESCPCKQHSKGAN